MAKELSEFEAYNHINQLFGGSARMAEEVEKVDIIPSTSIALDRALGVGGWPRGRIIQLAGQPSSGKTLLSLVAIAEWQRKDPENCAAFLDAEYTYDAKWAEQLGVDNRRILLVKDNSGVNLFTGLIGQKKINPTTKKVTKIPGLLDFIAEKKIIKAKHPETNETITINCGKLGVIVLDSVASVNTPTEDHSEVGKQNMALMGRFLSVELKKLTPAVAHANVAFIAINQVRTNLGQMFGDPTSTSGGNAWKHACSVMVMLAPKQAKESKILDSHEEQIGGRIMAKITKNKVAAPFKSAEYDLLFDSGVTNREEEMIETGVLVGVIQRPNNRSYVILDEKLGSRAEAIEFVKANYEKVSEQVRANFGMNSQVASAFEGEEADNPFSSDASEELTFDSEE
jgi:recombination protein RecA